MGIYNDFYDLSHNDILNVLNGELSDYSQSAKWNYNKLMKNRRSTSTRMECRNVALIIDLLNTLADNLELDTSDESIFKATEDFYNLPFDHILCTIRNVYREYKNNLEDMESQLQYDSCNSFLKNKYYEADNVLHIFRCILESLYININENDDSSEILSDDYSDGNDDYGDDY